MSYESAPSVDAGKWLGLSIASTLLCCLPLGIVGIVYAAMAMDAQGRGDWGAAQDRVDRARMWTTWSFGLGLVAIVLGICVSMSQDGSSGT